MHGARLLRLFVFLLWRGFLPGAPPPWRRPSGRARFFLGGGGLRADIGPRPQREGLCRGAAPIGLPDQLRQFHQRLALAAHIPTWTAITVRVGRETAVLIPIIP